MENINRRDFITFSSLATTSLFLPTSLFANTKKVTWKGKSLGANSSITVYTEDEKYAKNIIEKALKEVKRLENIFSLFRNNSDIVKLNENAYLNNPKKEFVELLNFAQKISNLSDGYFDVSVQNLWIAYSKFSNNEKLLKKELKKRKELISWKNIEISNKRISFKKENMKITLNALAQGFITDKITQLFKQNGLNNVLINFGEFRSLGKPSQFRDWRLSINETRNIITLKNLAVSTSASYGTKFNEKYHHLFNPKKVSSFNSNESISVVAQNATLADALSTTLAVMPKKKREAFLNNFPNVKVYIS